MGNCGSCAGNCESCGGCAGSLVLTEKEVEMLQLLGQVAFLPVVRKASDMIPVYPESNDPDTTAVLECLEKKGLIDLDYRAPLAGFDYSGCKVHCVHGSMALTVRGQQVLELLEVQGAATEA
jgi:hypothetical protein